MGNQVAWQVELAVKPGALEALRVLTAEMVAATRHKPGVLYYGAPGVFAGKFTIDHYNLGDYGE
jgi:hypothetical protein